METNDSKMLQELKTNTTGTARAELARLYKEYDLCVLGNEMHDEQCKDIINQVLNENNFRAVHEYKPRGCADAPKVGDRITSEGWTCALSETDFARLMALCVPRWNAAGLTDADGVMLTPWVTMKVDARNAVLDYLIGHIIPSSFRDLFQRNRWQYSQMEKLIGLGRQLVA